MVGARGHTALDLDIATTWKMIWFRVIFKKSSHNERLTSNIHHKPVDVPVR